MLPVLQGAGGGAVVEGSRPQLQARCLPQGRLPGVMLRAVCLVITERMSAINLQSVDMCTKPYQC